jgi:hypothetical protein
MAKSRALAVFAAWGFYLIHPLRFLANAGSLLLDPPTFCYVLIGYDVNYLVITHIGRHSKAGRDSQQTAHPYRMSSF